MLSLGGNLQIFFRFELWEYKAGPILTLRPFLKTSAFSLKSCSKNNNFFDNTRPVFHISESPNYWRLQKLLGEYIPQEWHSCSNGILHNVLHPNKSVCLFVPSLSSCYEKARATLYFGRIRTCLGVVHFRFFLWLLTTEFAACSKPPCRDNQRKAPFPRTQQRVR